MTREELSQMIELLRDTAKLHQPNEEILTDVKAENFIFVMDSVLSALSENKEHWEDGNNICPKCGEDKFKGLEADIYADWQPNFCPNCGADMRGNK